MKYGPIFALCAAALLTAGCSRESVADSERTERANARFAEALSVEAAGNIAGAESLYRDILKLDNSMASAHLNLAIILHDRNNDYLGAYHHYQSYLDLRPDSEKASMVRERREAAKTLLATQLSKDIVERNTRAVTQERDELAKQLAKVRSEASALRETNETQEKKLNRLTSELDAQKRLVESMKRSEREHAQALEAEVAKARKAAEKAVPDIQDETPLTGDALIDAVREDAQRMIIEEDGGQKAVNEATRKAVEGKQDERPISAAPVAGKRYVVRPGDTFSQISREAYGSAGKWEKIREANRSTTNPNGRLRAGDTILIP